MPLYDEFEGGFGGDSMVDAGEGRSGGCAMYNANSLLMKKRCSLCR